MDKASGGDGISVELFQILKDNAMEVLHSICQQIWKTQQWPQDWKRSVFIPIPKKGFGLVNKAEVDVFLELSSFFNDPTDVGNLVSGSSAFLKSSLNIWKFMVHVLFKPGLENFEHYFASM